MEAVPGLAELNEQAHAPVSGAVPRSPGEAGAFDAQLDAASEPHLPPKNISPELASYNARHLLGGQFPPPESGAGYLFLSVSLLGEDTY